MSNGPPWTDWLALQTWQGTYVALVATFPAPSIWSGFRVFTPDEGWCAWKSGTGWLTFTQLMRNVYA